MEKKPQTLDETLYHLTVICDELAKNQHEATKQTVRTEQLLKQFVAQIDDFEKTKKVIAKEVLEGVYNAASECCSIAMKKLHVTVEEKINSSIKELNNAVEISKKQVETCTKKGIFADWTGHLLGFTISLSVSVLVSIIMVKVLMPLPRLPMTAQLVDTCYYGSVMESVLGKITKEEKQLLEKKALDAIKTEEIIHKNPQVKGL